MTVLQIFIPNLFAAVAFMGLCCLIARFVDKTFVLYVAALWFLVLPILANTIPAIQK